MFSKEKIRDKIKFTVISGKGGSGCASFASSKRQSRGGPDGGDGGKGGSVYLKTNPQLKSFSHLRNNSTYKAEPGKPGGSHRKTGRKGKDLYIEVPLNTWVKTKKHNMLLSPDESFLIAQGGLGGRGNNFFKNSVNQAPTKKGLGKLGQTLEISVCLEE